jgi:hypothetical protein
MSRPLRPRLPLSQLFTQACAKFYSSLPTSPPPALCFWRLCYWGASRCQRLGIARGSRDGYSVI